MARIRSIKPEIRESKVVLTWPWEVRYFWVPVEVVGVTRWNRQEFDRLLGPNDWVVYRMRSADDALLYVGISGNPVERWRQHRIDKSWWAEISSISFVVHGSEHLARKAERVAIETEWPRHNLHLAVR